MNKTNLNPFETPESLKVLGIELCQNCGKHMSNENKTCYSCGFENDNIFINETCLNQKYLVQQENEDVMFLVLRKQTSYNDEDNSVYHIMKNETTLCGTISQRTNPFVKIGKMTFSRIPTFYKNPCKRCLNALEKTNN